MSKIEAAGVSVDKIGGRAGAVVSGVHLSGDLDEATVAAIRGALLDHKVVFFRDQGHLDDTSHEAFASLLGAPVGHPTGTRKAGPDSIRDVAGAAGARANVWHTDVSFVADYPSFSLLRAIEIPPYGGETAWANTVAAYASLPVSLQRLAHELWALHSSAYDYLRPQEDASTIEFETEHPVVRVHPETGEPSLLLGLFARRITGVSASDSALLMQLFQNHITRLENTVRWHWAPGDLVIWDNRATQHYALDDYGDLPRRHRRLTVEGEIPVSVDGRSSVIVKGADSDWYRQSPQLAVA